MNKLIQPFIFSDIQIVVYNKIISKLLWLIAALMLWVSVSGYWDTLIIYRNRYLPRADNLETVNFKIIHASTRTPNFQVQFNDGTTQYLSFPNFLGFNGKAGLNFDEVVKISDANLLSGCSATAKINSVQWTFFDSKQIWELNCPGKGISYGPDTAEWHVTRNSSFHLINNLFLSSMMLIVGLGTVAANINVSNKIRRQEKSEASSNPFPI